MFLIITNFTKSKCSLYKNFIYLNGEQLKTILILHNSFPDVQRHSLARYSLANPNAYKTRLANLKNHCLMANRQFWVRQRRSGIFPRKLSRNDHRSNWCHSIGNKTQNTNICFIFENIGKKNLYQHSRYLLVLYNLVVSCFAAFRLIQRTGVFSSAPHSSRPTLFHIWTTNK